MWLFSLTTRLVWLFSLTARLHVAFFSLFWSSAIRTNNYCYPDKQNTPASIPVILPRSRVWGETPPGSPRDQWTRRYRLLGRSLEDDEQSATGRHTYGQAVRDNLLGPRALAEIMNPERFFGALVGYVFADASSCYSGSYARRHWQSSSH